MNIIIAILAYITSQAAYPSLGFPGGSDGKESACNAGELGLIPGLGRSPGEGDSNPLQYSCLENCTNRRVWCTIQEVADNRT